MNTNRYVPDLPERYLNFNAARFPVGNTIFTKSRLRKKSNLTKLKKLKILTISYFIKVE